MLSLYEELKVWQGAIGSLLGFVALMVAALWNFHLNRKRDAALRSDEALSVAAALYGEIMLLRKEAAQIATIVAKMAMRETRYGSSSYKIDSHFLEAYKLSEPMFYKILAPQIGLLSADLVIAITEFHRNFQEVKISLPLLVENSDRGYDYSWSSVLIPARDAVKNIIPASRKIEQLTSISTPMKDLELREVEEFIEFEQIQYDNRG